MGGTDKDRPAQGVRITPWGSWAILVRVARREGWATFNTDKLSPRVALRSTRGYIPSLLVTWCLSSASRNVLNHGELLYLSILFFRAEFWWRPKAALEY